MKTIGELLQSYRKANNLTQADLATRMSELGYPIKNGAISTWEKNSSVPNANQFLALCQILNITDIYNTFININRKIPLRLKGYLLVLVNMLMMITVIILKLRMD